MAVEQFERWSLIRFELNQPDTAPTSGNEGTWMVWQSFLMAHPSSSRNGGALRFRVEGCR